jgi:class 3 adenylate cyclase
MSGLPTGTVTLLAMDIEGSQRLIQQLRDDWVALLEEIRALLRSEVERRDGQEVEVSGDTALFVFRRARDAAAAAVAVKHALHEHEWPDAVTIAMGMGLHTGEPALSADGYVGVDVYRAFLVEQAGSGDQILVSDATRQLIQDDVPPGAVLRDLGERRLGSLDRPERLSELVVEGLPSAAPRQGAWSELPGGTVTFLFSDIEGSTELTRSLGDDWPAVHAEHRRRLRTSFTEGGGREVDTQGDSFFFVFGRARHALAAAAAGQRALQEPWPGDVRVPVRMGIHTGEPAIGEEGYLGIDVVRGARIASLARGGQVLVSETTRALVRGDDLGGLELRDLGERELKGLGDPERVFELVVPGLEPPLPAPADDEPAFPVAGREQELASRALALVPDLSSLEGIGPRIEEQVQETLRRVNVPGLAPAPTPRSSEAKLLRLLLIGFAGLFLLLAFVVAVLLLLGLF